MMDGTWFSMFSFMFTMMFYVLLWVVLSIILAVFVYKDAKMRYPEESSEPIIWLIIVLLTGVIGAVIYMLAREY